MVYLPTRVRSHRQRQDDNRLWLGLHAAQRADDDGSGPCATFPSSRSDLAILVIRLGRLGKDTAYSMRCLCLRVSTATSVSGQKIVQHSMKLSLSAKRGLVQ